MNEMWFSASHAWIAPTVLGVTCGVFGSIAGILVPRGYGKVAVMAAYWALLAISLAMLLAGIVAVSVGQPYGVWYSLCLGGGIGCLVLGANYYGLVAGMRNADERRMKARDFN